MKTQTEKILDGLRIISWIAFTVAAVEALMKVVVFAISFINVDMAMTLSGTDMKLTELRKNHLVEYVFLVSFLLVVAGLNVQVWEKVKNVLTKINLKNPFSHEIAKMLETLGYLLFSIWLVSLIADGYVQFLSKRIEGLDRGFEMDYLYLFNAGIVFIVSQIFKRGVELQEENELTV